MDQGRDGAERRGERGNARSGNTRGGRQGPGGYRGERSGSGSGYRGGEGRQAGAERRASGSGPRSSSGRERAGGREGQAGFQRSERRLPRDGDRRDPAIPEEIDAHDLDRRARAQLRGLSKDNADRVARHLVVANLMLEDDPELAYQHARAAADHAGRISVVRESAGIAAYVTGRYAEALRELRTARRISGQENDYLALIADCERGLGRPERAVELLLSPAATALTGDDAAEVLSVLAGARCDLGEFDAARQVLRQVPRDLTAVGAARLAEAQEYVDLRAAGQPDNAAGVVPEEGDEDGSTVVIVEEN